MMTFVILEKNSGELSILGNSDGISFGVSLFPSRVEWRYRSASNVPIDTPGLLRFRV